MGLTVREREERQQKYGGRWVPSAVFQVKREGICVPCGLPVLRGSDAVFRRVNGLGGGQLCHSQCVDREAS